MTNELMQTTFDYSLLTPDQAERTQDAELRIIGRTQKTIVENGKDLLAVKVDIGHGHFVNWVRSIGMSEDTAQRWMSVAEAFIEIPQSAVFDKTALYLLSSSKVPESARDEAKQRAVDGEKITEEVARQIRDAHKAKELAEEAEHKAREQAQTAQQQLFAVQSEAQSKIDELTQQIASLQGEVQELTTPEVKIVEKEVIPEGVTQKIQALQKQVERLVYERDNETKRAESFAQKYQEDMAEREEAKNHDRIRQNWRSSVSQTHSALMRLLAQWPTPVDTQSFEADDWAQVDHLKNTLKRVQEECDNLYSRGDDMIIDAAPARG